MASQSLVAFLAEAGAKVEPRSNGDAEVASETAGDSAPPEERALDTSSACTTLNDNATALPDTSHALDAAHTAPISADVTLSLDVHIHTAHAAPSEEAQMGEVSMESTGTVESIEKPLSPNNAMPSTMPSTMAVITGGIETDDTPFTAAGAASVASEAIMTPSTETMPTETTTLPSTEAVIVDAITLDSDVVASMPSTQAVIADSTDVTDPIAVATADSTVVAATDISATLVTDSTAPITTDSTIIEPISSGPDVLEGSSPDLSKPGIDPPLEELNQTAAKPEEDLPPELDSIQVPPHWYPKPCVHISSIGGALTEEELLPLFSKFGPIASVTFENDRHDAVLIRYDLHLESGEELLAQVREATNSTKLGDKTLIVEPFRPDSLLFVGNLTPSIDDASLQAMFEPHGKIERAFVLKNADGQTKCYGFVEYSLKAQAMTAKAVMGNINMDGRVLRVEWSDCKKVEDMFSTVLFIDRIPREGPQVEGALKSLFGRYGKIRDSHLAIGTGNQIRGFAFIDFYHSASADKAHQALDGHAFEGSSIRVSFANPSKSAQSYRFRYGAQAGQGPNVRGVGGAGAMLGPPPRGFSRGPSPRVPTQMPLLPSRFMSPARPGMLGFGIGMQFGRGSFDRGPGSSFHGGGRGMVGPSSFGPGRPSLLMGNMPPRAGMPVVENSIQKLPFGQGPVTITPSAIVQVATAQARAREEEAKARAEAAKHGVARSFPSADSLSVNHYQRLQQQLQHQNFLQQQQANSYEQQYKQGDLYTHQQAHPASLHSQPQAWNQVPQPHGQQNMQLQRTPYHTTASQHFPQQHQALQTDGYYQQGAQHSQQHGYASQYGHQHAYQYSQQTAPVYGQAGQQTSEQYMQSAQQAQAAYPQQNYGDQYAAQQQASQQGYYPPTSLDGSAGVDAAQQQAYAAYYQQQAQAQAQTQAATNTEAGATAAAAATQQSYEAQWAAYYASQAAYQQQTASTDVGQKRSADQMDASVQNQAAYNYAGYAQQGGAAYQQQQQQQVQPSNENAAAYQAQANSAAYQQQAVYAGTAYQQQGYQQTAAPAVYGQTGYEQASAATADGGYQQQAAAFQSQAAAYDYSKKPRF